jgi:hypothetical protein
MKCNVLKEFIEAGVLEKMVPLIDEESSAVSTKALLAVSSLVRGFPLGTALARRLGVVGKLVHLVTSKADDVRACRFGREHRCMHEAVFIVISQGILMRQT